MGASAAGRRQFAAAAGSSTAAHDLQSSSCPAFLTSGRWPAARGAQIDILRKLEHPNIVGVKEVVVDRENTYIIMELLSGGEVKRGAQQCTSKLSSADARADAQRMRLGDSHA